MRDLKAFILMVLTLLYSGVVGCVSARLLPEPIRQKRLGLFDRGTSESENSDQKLKLLSQAGAEAPASAEGTDMAGASALLSEKSDDAAQFFKRGRKKQLRSRPHIAESTRKSDSSHASAAREIHSRDAAVSSLDWPLDDVEVTSTFGRRGRSFHEGIDLKAKHGTPVYAAQAGKVLYSGSKIRGYGRMVILRHNGAIATVYAHNSRLMVRKGEFVKKGQLIAMSGNTGHSSGPHLHFEVRRGFAAVDPLVEMPSMASASSRVGRIPVSQALSAQEISARESKDWKAF